LILSSFCIYFSAGFVGVDSADYRLNSAKSGIYSAKLGKNSAKQGFEIMYLAGFRRFWNLFRQL
jgi:hypothetical protein